MSEEIKLDVSGNSSKPADAQDDVENIEGEGDDKTKNFAKLRDIKIRLEKESKAKDEEIANLRKALGDNGNQDLKTDNNESNETLKVIFNRDLKEATLRWTKDNKVSQEDWAKIRDKVTLKGDETLTEITEKITEAYQSLPTVKDKLIKDAFEKGKREAMRNFRDDELDIGSGGDFDMGSSGDEPVLDNKTKTWAKAFGLTNEEIKNVDMDGNPNKYKILDSKFKDKIDTTNLKD